jgi:hypothetical protein
LVDCGACSRAARADGAGVTAACRLWRRGGLRRRRPRRAAAGADEAHAAGLPRHARLWHQLRRAHTCGGPIPRAAMLEHARLLPGRRGQRRARAGLVLWARLAKAAGDKTEDHRRALARQHCPLQHKSTLSHDCASVFSHLSASVVHFARTRTQMQNLPLPIPIQIWIPATLNRCWTLHTSSSL